MKTRSIEELHDKEIGHKRFAKIVDILIERKYSVTDIKEYNEKFKFKVDGFDLEYRKEWKSSAKAFAEYIINIVYAKKHLEECWRS